MRTNAIIRIIFFSLAIVVLLTILAVGLGAKLLMADHATYSEETESSSGTVDADAIRNLSIDWTSGSITIRPADVSAITLTEQINGSSDSMVFLQTGDTLKISYWKDKNRFPFGAIPDKDLIIEVPRDWQCDVLEIDTASADVDTEDLTIGKVEFDGASGAFDFRNCILDSLDVDTASGDIRFNGSLNVLDCDAASADCEMVLHNCPSRIEMDMASGDLDLTLPEHCGFTANMEALSGRLESDFAVSRVDGTLVCGDGNCRIDISAMSGNVFIHKSTEAWNCDH